MTKRENLTDENSCWSRALDDEEIFVLLERDAVMPSVIKFWAEERVRLGLNKEDDDQIKSALEIVERIYARRLLYLNSGVLLRRCTFDPPVIVTNDMSLSIAGDEYKLMRGEEVVAVGKVVEET